MTAGRAAKARPRSATTGREGWIGTARSARCTTVGVPIAAAWSQVVAVVVGGLITAGFTLLIEWQRRRRERRVAERLLLVEVDDAARTFVTVVGDLRDGKQWPHETKGWSQAWTGQRQALATGGVTMSACAGSGVRSGRYSNSRDPSPPDSGSLSATIRIFSKPSKWSSRILAFACPKVTRG